MVFFPNEKLELFEYTETSELNSYLEPKSEYVYKETVPCDFQSTTPNDDMKEFGEIREDTYKIYIDSNVPVDSSMILRLEGKPETYEITGSVIDNNHLLPVRHKKLVVIQQRKPTPVIIPDPDDEDDVKPTETDPSIDDGDGDDTNG